MNDSEIEEEGETRQKHGEATFAFAAYHRDAVVRWQPYRSSQTASRSRRCRDLGGILHLRSDFQSAIL